MEQNLLSLKNIYRLITVNDYPVWSEGVIRGKNKKGITLIKFWTQNLLYEFRNTAHGRQIWRVRGSQNRYHSELCNRKTKFPLYRQYNREIEELIRPGIIWKQCGLFSQFLEGRQYSHETFMRKAEEFLKAVRRDDMKVTDEIYGWLAGQMEGARQNRNGLPESFLAGWILTNQSLFALEGEEMDSGRLTELLKDVCPDAQTLWLRFHDASVKTEKVEFLTNWNSALCQERVPSAFFFGREKELFDLKELLVRGGHFLISGIGGIGKTELLRQLLAWCTEEKTADRIGVIQYEDSLAASFSRSFPELTGETESDRFHECLYRLSGYSGERVVLWIDNLDRTGEEDQDLKELRGLSCTVLISSRNTELEGFEVYPLKPTDKEASALIFRSNYERTLSRNEKTRLDALLETEGFCHPLTMRLLGRQTKAGGWAFDKMAEELEERKLQQIGVGRRTDHLLYSVYRSLYQMASLSAPSRRLLRMFAIFPHETLDYDFLESFLSGFLEEGETIMPQLELLSVHGWLEKGTAGCRMHPVIAESIRTKAPQEKEFTPFWTRAQEFIESNERGGFRENERNRQIGMIIFHAAAAVCGEISQGLFLLALRALHTSLQDRYSTNWQLNQLEHLAEKRDRRKMSPLEKAGFLAVELDSKKKALIDEAIQFHDSPEFQTIAASEAGHVFEQGLSSGLLETGNFEKGKQLLQNLWVQASALNIRLDAAAELGSALCSLKSPEEALRVLTDALLLAAENMEKKDLIPGIVKLYMARAYVYSVLWRVKEARQDLESVGKLIEENGYGEFSVSCMNYYIITGELEWKMGNLDAAVFYMEKVKKGTEIYKGIYSIDYFVTVMQLGIIYGKKKEWGKSLEYYQEILDGVPGSSSYEFIFRRTCLNNAAVTCLDMGAPQKAEPYLREAWSIAQREQIQPVGKSEIAWNLARVCRELHPEEEEHWLRIAVEGFEAHYLPDHPKRVAARERLDEVIAEVRN